jgi:hypothetical protein
MVRRHSASEKCRWPVGLRKCIRPLLEGFPWAMMECAALCSSLSRQSCEDFFLLHRFRERRVRPLSHLIVRQQQMAEGLVSWR